MVEQVSLWSRVIDWLLAQAPAIVIACVALWSQNRRITALLLRNEQLSDVLTSVVQKHSDERLELTREHANERSATAEKHARERENLQTDHLLKHDSTLRNILHSFEQGLLTKLGE